MTIESFFLWQIFKYKLMNAEAIKTADHTPKMYRIVPIRGDTLRCPSSRIAKLMKVKNKKVHDVSPTFHKRRYLYATNTRIIDNHQKIFDRITWSPILSSSPYWAKSIMIIMVIPLNKYLLFGLSACI